MSGAPGPVVRTRVQAFGDSAVLVELQLPPGPTTWRLVHDLIAHLTSIDALRLGVPGWEPPVAGAATVLLPVDPVEPGAARAVSLVEAAVTSWHPSPPAAAGSPQDVIEVPVRYGGDAGPDLGSVARLTGLSAAEVVAAHSGALYDVAFLGFAPGFAYLGPLPESLVLPRRHEPRPRVPAGSVAIGGPQTAVYPGEGPGGWWLIGRTALPVWDPLRDPAALFRPGARVRFRPLPSDHAGER